MKLWEEVAEAVLGEVVVLSAEAEVAADVLAVAVLSVEVAVLLAEVVDHLGVAADSVSQEAPVQAVPLSVRGRSSPVAPFLEAVGADEDEEAARDAVSGAA